MANKITKKEKDNRATLILVLLVVLLLILIVIIVATKTNQGRMKDTNKTIEVISLPEGTYYQDGDNKDVYLRVNSYQDGKINFDLKAGELYESINALINNNTGIAELDSDNGSFKVKINIAEDVVELLVTESQNDFFQIDESYKFER